VPSDEPITNEDPFWHREQSPHLQPRVIYCPTDYQSVACCDPKPLPERREFQRGESPLLQHTRLSDQLVYAGQGGAAARGVFFSRMRLRRLGSFFSGFALIAGVALPIGLTTSASALGHAGTASNVQRSPHQLTDYIVGTPDPTEPSGQAAPTTSAIPGYALRSVTNFTGTAVPAGWSTFSGASQGDPGSSWSANHVTVSGNLLQLTTSESASGAWVSGGICQCSQHFRYGAVFIRSRITGPGPTQVEMLWPVTGGWPPELDFVETYGGTTSAQATLHYSKANLQIHKNIDINMTAWHTWGVVWSPTAIDYTVDGKVWAAITEPSAIPDQAMALHIQQQTWCSSNMACPTSTQSTQVNWVAEYTSSTPEPLSVGSFTGNSVLLSANVKARIRQLARIISDRGDSAVTLTGYADASVSQVSDLAVSRQRASNVRKYLQQQLALLKDSNVSVVSLGVGANGAAAVTLSATAVSGKVFALLK